MSTLPHFVHRPGPKPTPVLVVHQLWGDLLLESRTLRIGEGLTAGAARDLHLRVLDTTVARLPAAVVGPMAVPGFFEVVDHSRGDLDAPGDVMEVIEADGERWRLCLEPDDEVWGDAEGMVPVDGEVVLRRGPLTYRIHQDVREAPLARTLVEPEPTLWSSFSSLGAMALALVAVTLTAPEPPQVELIDLPERVTRVVLTPPEPEPEPEPTPVDTERGGDGAAAAGPPRDEVGTGGPSVDDAGLLAALDGGLLGDANLDLSLVAATGTLRAGSANGVPGGGGLGPRGGSLTGGGTADGSGDMRFRPGMEGVGDGLLPGGKQDGQLVEPGGPPLLIGALPASAIDEVIKRNLPQIRNCYQRRLAANPGLGGKLTVRFTISGDGSVSAAKVARATLQDDSVHSCVVGRLLKMRFPEPQGGGIVSVTYPFLFSPG